MAAEDNQEYKKLPPEERCVCKAWKGRIDGLEESIKIFREIDDEKSNEWQKFVPIIKKVVADSHALAQEKGLEAALIFVENSFFAGRTVNDVMSAIVQKCIAAPKTKTKELSVQVALMYVEIEKHEAVIEELIKGMEHKNPKIVAACASTCTLALKEFGSKVVSVKALIKKLAPLMSDRDKTVREEGKQMAIEIYRWIGAAMKSQITTLPPITIKELEDEFDKLKGEKPEPIRYLRSQQEKQQQFSARATANGEEVDEDYEAEAPEDIDPMDLIDPVDILSRLPKDFYEKLEEKKWTLRKESLEALEKLLIENPKLENGEYGTLIHTLKKIITKDTNVVLVAMGTKCLAMLAKGLGKRFTQYAMLCIPFLLEKFKEKKSNVLTALREAMDTIYPSTSLESMQEYIVESLGNKNPSVKSETASFLARAFTITQPTAINKKLLKVLTVNLTKTLNESDPTVRDCSAEALGTLMKLVGEKAIGPLLVDIDPLKVAKIKECHDKAEIKVKVSGAKRPMTASSGGKQVSASSTSVSSKSIESKPVSRPNSAAPRKTMAKKPSAANDMSAASKSSLTKGSSKSVLATEREMSTEEIAEKACEILPADILNGLTDSNWKNRLAAVENLMGSIGSFDAKTPGISQILIKTVSCRKPGLKEMNFQVLKIKLDIIRMVAETYPITTVSVDVVVNEVTEKLADPKNGTVASDVLLALAEYTKLEYVAGKVFSFAFEQKSPKVQSESLNWLNKAIQEFGLQIQPKTLIEDVRKAVQSTNPIVRGSAINLIGTLSMYMGSALIMLFENEKPALKAQIQTEFDKNVSEKPPKPIRGVKKSNKADAGEVGGNGDDGGNGADDDSHEQINLADLLPRIDIAPQLTEALLKEIADKDWKNRNEGLNKLQNIISEAKLIKPSLGDLPQALALRLSDSNAKIAQSALAISEQLANAMGPGCKFLVRTLFPGFLHALGDSKSFVRAAALNCINTFGEKGGYKEFFEGEMIADSLKSGSPALRAELWLWLAEHLPQLPPKSIPKDELNAMIPSLYAQICDRSAEIRKNANEAVLGVMIHLGYDAMVKGLDKQKPASKKDIQAALDKARPNLPVKPLPKGKQQAPIAEEPKKVVRGGGGGNGSGNTARATLAGKASSGGEKAPSRKKEEDVDTSPLLAINNTKNQRMIDEQKSRVLKWNFTTPREEYTDLLRDQMTVANVNKALMANMFHDDFRYHLKVIESLTEDLAANSKALVCNLDLILKWLSLRFYDTNPSVLIKGLEYLNQVFQILIEMEYILAEHEGTSFIPHLLLKLGDPKDTVRNGVRTLLRQILLVYPYTKVFSFVMEGLKSKNARQRTECLDELSYLIESYGLTVCQPSQQVALKEIAKQISDRDNSVRNAALNCVANAYFIAGEKIYKLIGQMSEKDLSMLDERIKRAKKTRKTPEAGQASSASTRNANSTAVPMQMVQQDSIEIEDPQVECDELPPPDEDGFEPSDEAQNAMETTTRLNQTVGSLKRQATFDQIQPATNLMQNQQPKCSGPFGLDPDKIAEIEKDWVRVDELPNVEIQRVDISLLYEPIVVKPSHDGKDKYPEEKFQQILASARYRAQTTPTAQAKQAGYLAGVNISPYISPQQNQQYGSPAHNTSTNLADMLPKLDPVLMRTLKQIGSADTIKARAAINEISDIVASPEKVLVLKDYEEIFITNVLAQMKNLSQLPTQETLPVYQPLLSILYSFFQTRNLGKQLSIACLKNLMAGLLNLMADQKLVNGDEMQYSKVINGICLKVLDRADFTNLNCALIRLLRETCPSAGLPKFLDLLMKCIWRNVKMLSERSNELNYDLVILEVHEFMLALPSSWWQTRPSDTPLRTVKTIIHNMAKVKGNAILQHLNVIPAHSELYSYLIKILKNLQREGSLPSASPQRSNSTKDIYHQSKRLSNISHDAMSQIFKLLSEKETKQQGLQKLYDFKVQNPEVDIGSFMKGASANFQKYIEDGLAEMERLHGGSHNNIEQTSSDHKIGVLRSINTQKPAISSLGLKSSDIGKEIDTNLSYTFKANSQHVQQQQQADPDYWMDRLNNWKAIANLGPSRNIDGNIINNDDHILDNKVVDENLCLNSMNGQKLSLIRTEKPEINPNRLQHIQAKLAKLKGSANTQI